MFQSARAIVTAGILAMVTALPVARADHHKEGDKKAAADDANFRTVWVCEPTIVEEKVTCYRNEKVCEEYTAYKCVTTPEKRTRTVTYYKKVPVTRTIKKAYCVSVPCVETKTVMEKHWVTKQETYYKTKTEDRGHWETKCVEVKPGLFERLGKSLRKKKCCDPCDPCSNCNDDCPRYETKKVWVPCKVCVKVPCTRCRKVCEYRPVCKKVCTTKKEIRYKECKVTECKCIPCTKQEEYTCCVTKKVPYKAKRWVCKRVPYETTVKKCKMVRVQKRVPIDPCADPCADPCKDPCGDPCCDTKRKRWFRW